MAGEMDYQLRTLAALAEDLSSIPRNHKVICSQPYSTVPGIYHPFLTSLATRHTHGVHTSMQTKHSLNKYLFFK